MLIELSGIDGSGKTTLAERIAGAAIRDGIATYQHRVKLPSRRLLSAVADPNSKQEFFGTDAVELVAAYEFLQIANKSLRVLSPHELHIVDPYAIAMLAIADGHGASNVRSLGKLAAHAPAPDASFVLSIDATTALDRIKRRAQGDNILVRSGIKRLEAYVAGIDRAVSMVDYQVEQCDAAANSPDEIENYIMERLRSHPLYPKTEGQA